MCFKPRSQNPNTFETRCILKHESKGFRSHQTSEAAHRNHIFSKPLS